MTPLVTITAKLDSLGRPIAESFSVVFHVPATPENIKKALEGKDELIEEVNRFAPTIGRAITDPYFESIDMRQGLDDARTLLEIGKRYNVMFYGIPYEEHRPTGRPTTQLYDLAFRWIASGRLSHDQARTLAYAMHGIDLGTLSEDERKDLENRFKAAMRRRKVLKT